MERFINRIKTFDTEDQANKFLEKLKFDHQSVNPVTKMFLAANGKFLICYVVSDGL